MQIPIHISNAERIKELADTVVRHARNDHPRLEESFDEFVKEGIDNPGYAKSILRGAYIDGVLDMAKAVANGEITSEEYRYKAQHGETIITELFEKSEAGNRLNENFMKQHPETWMKRVAVLKGLSEGNKSDRTLCSKYKGVKKL